VTGGPPVLRLARDGEPVRYVLIDDEPRYRHAIELPGGLDLTLAGSYGTIDAFLAIQSQPCHVVVLDLCLNRQTGDKGIQPAGGSRVDDQPGSAAGFGPTREAGAASAGGRTMQERAEMAGSAQDLGK
jgi:hypothetical protein